MKRIIHLSDTTRKDGDCGGVPKFAWYLRQAIGCEIYKTSEIDNLLKNNIINENTLCIVDGATGLFSLPEKIKILSVVHGTWKEFAIKNNMEKHWADSVDKQHLMWTCRANYKGSCFRLF